MEDRKTELLTHLEDLPALVEVRGLLRRGRTSLVPSEERAESGFVLAPDHDLAVAFGAPEPALAEPLGAAAHRAGVEPGRLRLRAAPQVLEEWLAGGAVATGEPPSVVEVLSWAGTTEGLSTQAARHETRLVEEGSEVAGDLPPRWRRELEALEVWPAAAVALAGGMPVALAYAFVETETLWDVSVETEAPFRREGFGACAAAALTLERAEAGRWPVWSVASTNRASIALAQRLGFVPATRWADWRLP